MNYVANLTPLSFSDFIDVKISQTVAQTNEIMNRNTWHIEYTP